MRAGNGRCERIITVEVVGLTAKQQFPEVIDMARQEVQGRYGSDVDPLPLAAIGLTLRAWRRSDEVEDAHTARHPVSDQITDGEMFAANVATTRLILERLQQSYPAVDWIRLADDVTNPDRVAGRRSVSHLLGRTRHKKWAAKARRVIESQQFSIGDYGSDYCWCEAYLGMSASNWWGHPDWPELVTRFIDNLNEAPPKITVEELRCGLLDAPDSVDPELLDWCTSQMIGHT